MPAAMVADGRLDLLGDLVQGLQYLFDGLVLEARRLLQSGIQSRNVCSMMLVVVDFHGLGVYVRLQGAERDKEDPEV